MLETIFCFLTTTTKEMSRPPRLDVEDDAEANVSLEVSKKNLEFSFEIFGFEKLLGENLSEEGDEIRDESRVERERQRE
jgi:hypothetical protein